VLAGLTFKITLFAPVSNANSRQVINQSSVPCLNEPLYSDCGIVDVASSVTTDFFRNPVSLYACRMIARHFSPILKNTKLIVCYLLSLLVLRVLDR
jgi:hypothetical protein